MPIVTDGPMLSPERGIHELATPLGASLGATASEGWADSPISQLSTATEISRSKGDADIPAPVTDALGNALPTNGVDLSEELKPAAPRMDMIEALDRVKKSGLDKHLTLPNQPDIPPAQLEIMMRHARERAEREATIERGPQGFIPSALQVGTSFLVGAADPINVASAFIPVMGELRYGKLLASAGDSLGGRLALRGGVGAAQGVVGQAALEPLDWWAHTQEGRDFGMADVLNNIMFGAALGGGMHAAGGFISDAYRGANGRPLYPFGEGEPIDRIAGTHMPASLLREDGVSHETILGHTDNMLPESSAQPSPAVAIINDLPPRAHEDAMRGSIASLIQGEPVRAGEMLEAAANTDRRIADSFEMPKLMIGGEDVNLAAQQILDRKELADLRPEFNRLKARLDIGDITEAELDRLDRINRKVLGRANDDFEKTEARAIVSRGRAAADPQTWSLYEFLAHEGGLKPDPELAAVFGNAKGPFVPGFGALVRPKGRALDDALRLAKDHGYLFDAGDVTGAEGRLTPNDLLDRLAEENFGRKLYRYDQQHATKADMTAAIEREKHEILTVLHDEIEASVGRKGLKVDPALEDRVVQIVVKEGEHDVLAAYERAIMEDAERYETINHERSKQSETAHIPGWDVNEREGASRDGRALAQDRGQTGSSVEGQGRADGVQSRSAGPGNRGSVSTQLDKAADWRAIANVTPEFDAPEVIAASNAAAKIQPPKTKLDERVQASEKADAYAKSLYDMFAHRLPPEDRARLDEMIADLDRQKVDHDTVTQRGAACLFEGGGV